MGIVLEGKKPSIRWLESRCNASAMHSKQKSVVCLCVWWLSKSQAWMERKPFKGVDRDWTLDE